MIPAIKSVQAREILDSRGMPTVEAAVFLNDGTSAVSSVPSGTSVGPYEAVDLRDNEPARYFGKGVLRAVDNINKIIASRIVGMPARPQLDIDKTLIALDGSKNKMKLGANATLAVSQAVCKAGAATKGVPLYLHLTDLFGFDKNNLKIPTPIINVINGGKHGTDNLDFQEFQIIPSSRQSFAQSLRMAAEIYESIKKVLIQYKAIYSIGLEGGFAPNLFSNLDAFETMGVAIKQTPYQLKTDVYFGLDAAVSSLYKNGRYLIRDNSEPMSAKDLINYYLDLNEQYHLLILEDPLIEEDWNSWSQITQKLPHTIIAGDDLLATNKQRLNQAITMNACNSIVIKPNQIGTVAETIEVAKIARQAGFKLIVSHRSGDTNDSFVADFAVGIGSEYVKFGAPARGERVEKYNRLLAIESQLISQKP